MLRRVCRHLFTLCAAVSLVLCVAACAMWVRSYTVVEAFQSGNPVLWSVASDRGKVMLAREDYTPLGSEWMQNYAWARPPQGYHTGASPTHPVPGDPGVQTDFNFAGFVFYESKGATYETSDGTDTELSKWIVGVPWWALAMIFAPIPVARLRLRRLRAAGLCPQCGYDLRASPGRCPECGTLAAGAKGAAA